MDLHIFMERLRRTRLEHQWTQSTLAAKVGTYQGHISALEKGKRPSLEAATLFRLAKALGVSAEWLAGETDGP